MAQNLETKTGRSLDDWVAEVDGAELDGFSAIVDWLEGEHGLGHFQARLVAETHCDGRR